MPKRLRFAGMSPRDRMIWMKSHVVNTAGVKRIIKMCGRLYDRAGIADEGAGGLVLGKSGVGKSRSVAAYADALFEKLKAERPNSKWERPKVSETPIRPIWEIRPDKGYLRPFVVVVVNPVPRFSSLMRDTALALGVKLKRDADFGEAMNLVQHQIQQQEVKMMVFEEVQALVDAPIDKYVAADVLKIVIKAPLQVVCIGTMKAKRLIEDMLVKRDEDGEDELDEGNEQLRRLRRKQVTLRPLPCSLSDFPPLGEDGNPQDTIEFPDTPFRSFCKALDDRSNPEKIILPFDNPSNISHPQIALRLWRAGEGKVGQMMDLLLDATQLAIEKNMSKLTLPVMAAAYRDMEECSDKDNWFKMDWTDFHGRFETTKKEKKPSDDYRPPRAEPKLNKHPRKR